MESPRPSRNWATRRIKYRCGGSQLIGLLSIWIDPMESVISGSKIDPRNTILFVGAGVSAILGLPSWDQLIDQIAGLLGYDPRVFKLLGTPLSLAEFYK